MNPLLDFSGLPRFDLVAPEHVRPAIEALIAQSRATLARVLTEEVPATWDEFIVPMLDDGERLGRAWGMVGHLHSVNDVPVWRDAYNEMLPEVSSFYAELGQNLALFAKTRALADSPEYAALSAVRQRIIDKDLRDFRLSGAELPEDQKPRFKAIQEELSALAAKFSENLLDATNAHSEWITNEADLAGLPEDVKAAARAAAEKDDDSSKHALWKFSLHAPSYLPVMQYAENRELRNRMYRASATRASEFGKPDWDNGPLIDKILALRAEEAAMLGYPHYAAVSLAPKMAESAEQVAQFSHDMAARAKPFAQNDLAELREFAARELGMDTLESWDIPWASEKLKQTRYAFSDDEVKQYFPEHNVLAGLFKVVESLFAVSVKADTAPVWDKDVTFWRIERAGTLVGQFYLDLHARDTKRGGAWMDDARDRRRIGSPTDRRIASADLRNVQTPVAYLTCNFPSGVNGKPATFTHDDVITLFHECGHGLHHLLSEVDELPVSGINGVEWDAVELPSQFMENFCWEWEVLAGMTAHVDTGAALPRALYDKMIAAKNFQSGLMTLRQLELGLFDLRIHWDYQPGGARTVMDVLAEVRRDVAVLTPPDWNRFPNSFSHIFAGGYAAGYYSYKWAEVLSADAYGAFEEATAARGAQSTLDRTVGERFWKEILSVGGSRPALESFKAFRGREPTPDALLRHSGMAVAA
ncbi:MAG: M3 family metallopeptidase [Rhodocyclaceae bacterium]|nr:M3 family metallopeptidase [Rhodocyclaceae bacterium]